MNRALQGPLAAGATRCYPGSGDALFPFIKDGFPLLA